MVCVRDEQTIAGARCSGTFVLSRYAYEPEMQNVTF